MSTPPKLNYALLGLNDVFPFVDYDQNILIKGVLEAIGTDFEIPAWELEFWLVRDDMTSDWTKAKHTFPVEKANSL